MMSSFVENSGEQARRKVVAGIFPPWSMRIATESRLVTEISIQLPRSGTIQQECILRSPTRSSMKSMPGERGSWLTRTRSGPVPLKAPRPPAWGVGVGGGVWGGWRGRAAASGRRAAPPANHRGDLAEVDVLLDRHRLH